MQFDFCFEFTGNGNLTRTASGGQARPSGVFSAEGVAIATEIAQNEIAHVKYLRKALTDAGATPVPYSVTSLDPVVNVYVPTKPSFALQVACPSLSLSPETFTAAANASVVTAIPGATLDNYPAQADQFNPYEIEDHFYLAAFIFEDVGVTAYKGAIANLQVGHAVFVNLSSVQACLSRHMELHVQSAVRPNMRHA